jgi:hypothetical protein
MATIGDLAGPRPLRVDPRRSAALPLLLSLLLLASAAASAPAAPTPLPTDTERDRVLDEYFERFDRVEGSDAHLELALWCKEKGLDCQHALHLEAALRIDPDHAAARKEAGYVRYEGEIDEYRRKGWLTAEEAAEAAARDEELARAREAELEKRREDPMLAQVDAIVAKVHSDPYLGKIHMVPSEKYLPFLLFVENGREFHFDQIGTVLLEYLAFFRETFGDPFGLPPFEKPLVVLAFRDRKGYDDYCMHIEGEKPLKSRAAHYSSLTHEIVIHGWESITRNPFRPVINNGVFTHEATHQVFHYYVMRSSENPLILSQVHWFQEGIAEYLGTFRKTPVSRTTGKSRYIFGDRSPNRIAELRGALDAGAPMFSLEEMLSIRATPEMHRIARQKAPDNFEGMISRFYAQAWAFIYFLKEYEGGKPYWDRFLEYVRRELRGESNVFTAREVLAIQDVDAVEKEWLTWIREKF